MKDSDNWLIIYVLRISVVAGVLGRHLLHLSGEVGGEAGHPEHLLTSLQERL